MSAKVHSKRNLLVHGIAELKVDNKDPSNPKVHLLAEGRANGKDIKIAFTSDELETIAYEILHLGGRLNRHDENKCLTLSLPDIRALLDLLSLIPPDQSILPKLPDPLEP